MEEPSKSQPSNRLHQLPMAQDFVPRRNQEILAVLPRTVSAEKVLELLSREPSGERGDLVGAPNIYGGSGGGLGRFFEVGDRFLKTSRSRRFPSPSACLEDEGEAEQLRWALGIYHPARVWFLSHGRDGGFWACSLTPKLTIMREVFNREPASETPWNLFLRGVEIALEATAKAGIVLDCNPNNFGHLGDQIYYVDDDLRCPPVLVTQILLRLREYPSVPEPIKIQFLESFCALATRYPPHVLDRLGFRSDLDSRAFWPESPALQKILEGLRRQVL